MARLRAEPAKKAFSNLALWTEVIGACGLGVLQRRHFRQIVAIGQQDRSWSVAWEDGYA